MRHSHPLATALTAALLSVAACASYRLNSAPQSARQPVVTTRGAANESTGERIIVQAAGADTEAAQARLKLLTDAVRSSLSAPLTAGNKARILVDGPATFAAIENALNSARRNIHVETYIFADDELGERFSEQLIKKRKQGVEVRVIYDAIGSIKTPTAFFDRMDEAGVEVLKFQPLNPVKTWFWQMHNRDHRKLIVVDGRIAFTGGMNISSAYSSPSSSKPGPEAGLTEGWRDTQVQLEGPVVEQFQKIYLDTWTHLGGKVGPAREDYFPKESVAGDSLASAVASSGLKEKDESVYKTYIAAVKNASFRVWITQAYLLPPKEFNDALIEAVRRGVDVRILVPGFTDSKLVLHASHNEYEDLLAGGVRLFEAKDALLHAKTALIDDSLSIIGSANIDYRSFLHNNEVTAVIIGDEAAQRMRAIFERDLAQAAEISLAKWNERSVWQKTEEGFSGLFKYWL